MLLLFCEPRVYKPKYPINPMIKKAKKVLAKLTGGIQKRMTLPKMEETKDWEKGDLIELANLSKIKEAKKNGHRIK